MTSQSLTLHPSDYSSLYSVENQVPIFLFHSNSLLFKSHLIYSFDSNTNVIFPDSILSYFHYNSQLFWALASDYSNQESSHTHILLNSLSQDRSINHQLYFFPFISINFSLFKRSIKFEILEKTRPKYLKSAALCSRNIAFNLHSILLLLPL